MDLELLGKGLHHAERKKKWVLVLGTLGLTGYGAYRLYNLPFAVEKRQRLVRLLGTFVSLAEMGIYSAEAIGVLSKDLKGFLQSNCDKIPPSLNQISKIVKSDEFLVSLVGITRAVTVGILGGCEDEMMKRGNCSGGKGFPDRVVDKLFSDAGCGIVSVVVGSFARNLVMGLCSAWQHGQGSISGQWVDIACQDKCRELIGDCIRVFVSTAVAFYLEKTISINTYDQFFSGLTNPKHVAEARDLLVHVSKGAVETFVQSCHCIWAANSKSNPGYSKIDFEDSITEKGSKATSEGKKPKYKKEGGWLSQTPYKKFVLDMTGTVTFETMRSFLEFLLEKLLEPIKRSADIFQQKVVERGVEAVRNVTGKSSSVTTMCFNLCLNILNSPWVLAPH